MKLGDILKKAGAAVIRDAVPGGGLILDMVNQFLPDDKKLPKDATADQATAAIQSLTPDQQAMLMSKELDVQIEEVRSWTSIQEALAKADEAGASTRPWIAKLMAVTVVAAISIFMVAWAYAIGSKSSETLKALSESWEIMLMVIGTPTTLLRAYFGMRTEEKKARYGVAVGAAPAPAAGILGAILKR